MRIDLRLTDREADILVYCLTCCTRSDFADELWNLSCKLEAARKGE